jgi:hypothetical protein
MLISEKRDADFVIYAGSENEVPGVLNSRSRQLMIKQIIQRA